jgi:trigger factor
MKKRLSLYISFLLIITVLTSCGNNLYDFDFNDYITIGEYKGVELSNALIDSDIQSKTDTLLQENAVEQIVDTRAVQTGDIVNIDYIGTRDGVAFDGGTSAGYDLTIGSGSFIPGFEDGLIGHSTGESVSLDLKFPDDYASNTDLAGAEVVFDVTINSITEKITPELTDEFIAGLENANYSTVDEYKAFVRKNTIEQFAWDKVLAIVTVKQYPKKEVKAVYDNLIAQYKNMTLSSYNTSLENYVQNYLGTTVEDFYSQLISTAEDQVKTDIIIKLIAQKESLDDSDPDHAIASENAADLSYESYDAYLKAVGQASVNSSVISYKVLRVITDNVVYVD